MAHVILFHKQFFEHTCSSALTFTPPLDFVFIGDSSLGLGT